MWWNRKPEHRELLAFGLPTGHLHSRDLGQTLQTRVSACFLLEVHFGHVYFQVPVCLGSRVCLVLVACQWYGLACFPCVFSELVGSWPECWWVWGALVGHACSWLVCFWGATVLVPVVHLSLRYEVAYWGWVGLHVVFGTSCRIHFKLFLYKSCLQLASYS